MRTGERGFTYLGLLFMLAVGAALLARAGERWSLMMQREREREQVFRGQAIAAAIASYRSSAAVPGQGPRGLDELVEDRRGAVLRRHLRRVYEDPFTRKADWVAILAEDGSLVGVRSRSEKAAVLRLEDDDAPADSRLRLSDRRFLARPPGAAGPATRDGPKGPVR
jgi:type II secretory pathway pseudopilin PulG